MTSLIDLLRARSVPHGYMMYTERYSSQQKWEVTRTTWATTGVTYKCSKKTDWEAVVSGNEQLPPGAKFDVRPANPIGGQKLPANPCLAFRTEDFHILDIDKVDGFDELFPELSVRLKQECPYYLSRNKRYPHYLVKVVGFPKGRQSKDGRLKARFGLPGDVADLLTGQSPWVRPEDATSPLVNADKAPLELEFKELEIAKIKTKPKKKKKKKKTSGKKSPAKKNIVELIKSSPPLPMCAPTESTAQYAVPTESAMKELLEIVGTDLWADRSSWIKLGTVLKKEYGAIVGFSLFDRASQKAPEKYGGQDATRRQFESLDEDAAVGIGTIMYYAKTSDQSAYDEWKHRHTSENSTDAAASSDALDKICRKRGVPKEMVEFAMADDYEMLRSEDYGLAQIYVKLAGDRTVMTDDGGDGTAYVWSDKTLLWEKKQPAFCKIIIQRAVAGVVAAVSDFLRHKKDALRSEMNRPNLNSKYEETLKKRVKFIQKQITLVGVALRRCQSSRNASGIMSQVQHDCYDADFEKDINSSKHELPTRDGCVLNLRTMETRRRDIEDLWSHELPVSIAHEDEPEDARDAEQLLRSICAEDDPELKERPLTEYLTQIMGYCLTGETTERKFYVLHGHAMNGKSTLMDTLHRILKTFYVQLSDDVFIDKGRSGGATPELMPLLGARVGVLSETKKNADLEPKRVKELTGNDSISARALFKSQITFIPVAKYILMTNFLPRFDARDTAMNDRIRLVPFDARFQKNPTTQAFVDRFKEQGALDAVFRHFVKGAHTYYKNGCVRDPPERAVSAMNSYRGDLDTLGQFLELCQKGNDEKGQPLRWDRVECYKAFKEYVHRVHGFERSRDCPMLNRSVFYVALGKAGFTDKKTSKKRYILGLAPAATEATFGEEHTSA